MLASKNEMKVIRHREMKSHACAKGLWQKEAGCVQGPKRMRWDWRGEENVDHMGLTVMSVDVVFIFKNNNKSCDLKRNGMIRFAYFPSGYRLDHYTCFHS